MTKKIKKLYRNKDNRVLTGVCAGFADYIEQDPTIVRVLAVLITIFTGFFPGLIAYIIFSIIIPEK